jgi:hypothetical protein
MRRIMLLGACVALCALRCQGGQILFYSGPDQLHYSPIGLPGISDGYAVTDQFNLTAGSTVTEIGFSAWITSGDTPGTVSWAITTTPGLSDVLASGTGASLTNTLTASGVQGGNDVYWSTFDVSVPLSAGTYWLWLDNGTPATVGLGWGITKDSGAAEDFLSNGTFLLDLSETQSFELIGGPATATPEPSSLLLLGTALCMMGLIRIVRVRKHP